jgi:energy-coupling factor transport system permease protein
MQDARVRLASAALVSVAAFISTWGALAVLLWWLLFTPRMRRVKNRTVIFGMLVLIGVVAFLIWISGGDGFSYFARMGVIVLIGTWLYAEQEPGDFLSVAVWALGRRAGFDLGMIGECAMQIAESLSRDCARIRVAMKLKGEAWGVRNLVPAGFILIHDALVRAEDISELLAVRGYHKGGVVCPEFRTCPLDRVAGICAICVFFFAIIPVSEFFILYR